MHRLCDGLRNGGHNGYERLCNGYVTAMQRLLTGPRSSARVAHASALACAHARQASMKDVLMLLDDKASSEQVARTLGDLQVCARVVQRASCPLHTLE